MEKESSNKTRKKKKSLIETTNIILEKKGINPKVFDKEAIANARKVVYNDFVEENIEKLL